MSALRTRTGAVATFSLGHAWLSALRLAALLLVAHAAAQSAARAGRVVFSELLMGRGLTLISELGHPAALVAGVLALVVIAKGRYVLGITLAAVAVCAGCLAWSVMDARVPIAGGVLLLAPILSLLGFYLPGWANGRSEHLALLSSYLIVAATLVGISAVLVRRRARW